MADAASEIFTVVIISTAATVTAESRARVSPSSKSSRSFRLSVGDSVKAVALVTAFITMAATDTHRHRGAMKNSKELIHSFCHVESLYNQRSNETKKENLHQS